MKIFVFLTLDMISMSDLYLKILTNKEIKKEELNDPLDIYKTFAKYNDIDIAYYFYKTKDKNIYKYLKFKNIKLHITGNDLLKIGYKQGKIIGVILDSLLKEKINAPENFSKKQDELNWVTKNFHKN